MTRKQLLNIANDYDRQSRWASYGCSHYRIIGIGRKYARLMAGNGQTLNIDFADIKEAW